MKTSLINILILFSFITLVLTQCKTKDVVSTAEAELSPMVVRVLLKEGYDGRHMDVTYKVYKPTKIKPTSRSENWYRVIFDAVNSKAQLMAQLRSDDIIIKVETEEDLGTDVQKSKSLKRTKTAPIR